MSSDIADGKLPTTFFTACNARYWPFAVPYVVSVLHHNADAVVEVCVEDAAAFRVAHASALDVVARHFPGRFLIRDGQFNGVLANSVRFLETPSLRSQYTYIGDVDILILDRDVTAAHLAHMAKTGLPYSNRIRPGTHRLTGLHFTRTDAHYPLAIPPDANLRGNDEALLYRLVEAKGLPLPCAEHTFRPLHGIHFSLRRPPTPIPESYPHWALPPDAVDRYLALWETACWQEVSAHFHPAYRTMRLRRAGSLRGG